MQKQPARVFATVKGKKMGQVVSIGPDGAAIQAQGGTIVARRLRFDGGKKVAAAEAGLTEGALLGRAP